MSTIDRAILWDLDGTIVDTNACHAYTWESVLNRYGFEFNRRVYAENFGRNNTSLLPALLGFFPDDNLMRNIVEEKESLFRQIAANWITLVPGVMTWLKDARELNYRQAIASSAPHENINTMLAIMNLDGCFDATISGTDLPAKPRPDVFLRAADVLGVFPQDCLVIEDAIAGVQGALEAGMSCVAVATTHPPEELDQADAVIQDFTIPFTEILHVLNWD